MENYIYQNSTKINKNKIKTLFQPFFPGQARPASAFSLASWKANKGRCTPQPRESFSC